jgi:hypothetical protein
MQKWQPWETAGEAAWGLAMQREAVIRPLAEQARLRAKSVADAARQLGLSRSVHYEVLQRFRQRPRTSSLLPWKRRRKPNGSLLGDEREALLNTCMDEFYLQPERPSLAALHLEVRPRFAENDVARPQLPHGTTSSGSGGRDHRAAPARGCEEGPRETPTTKHFFATAAAAHGPDTGRDRAPARQL